MFVLLAQSKYLGQLALVCILKDKKSIRPSKDDVGPHKQSKLDCLFWARNKRHPRLVPDISQVCLQAVSFTVQTEIYARINLMFFLIIIFQSTVFTSYYSI